MGNTSAVILFSEPASFAVWHDGQGITGLQNSDCEALSRSMFEDVVERVLQLGDTDVVVYHDGVEFSEDFAARFLKRVSCREVEGNTPAEKVRSASENAVADHYERFIVLTENQPVLGKHFFRQVLDQLTYEDNCAVIGPTFDKTWYLLGMKSDHNSLLGSLPGDSFLESASLFERLCCSDTVLFPMHPRYSLNSAGNLELLRNEVKSLQDNDSDFPRSTFATLRMLEKKHKFTRGPV